MASRGRVKSSAVSVQRDNGVSSEAASGQLTTPKTSRTHNELHKELLLAHKRGLALSSRTELQQVLERRRRVQSDREEEEETRTPLEDELIRRQQKLLEKEKQDEEQVQEDVHLMEFVRVRQNLRKIHTVIQSRAANGPRGPDQR
ncbi:actin-associated protein FAM107A [Synchiropus picturatus]